MTRSVLQPGQRDGLAVPEARGWRLRATSQGSVVEELPDGTRRTVARPGEIASVVTVRGEDLRGRLRPYPWARAARNEVLSLLGDERVLLTVPLTAVQLDRPSREVDVMRRTSGVQDFAQTLGHGLQRADRDQVRRVNQAHDALRRGPSTTALRRLVTLHAALATVVVVAAVVRVAVESSPDVPLPLGDLAIAVPLVLLALSTVRLASRFVRGWPPPDLDGVQVRSVAGPGSWQWMRESTVTVGSAEIAWRWHAREVWAPGPAAGGAVLCTVSPDAVIWRDRHDEPVLTTPAALWDADDVGRACAAAGIRVERREQGDLPFDNAFDFSPDYYPQRSSLLATLSTPLVRGLPLAVDSLFVLFAGLVVAAFSLITLLRALLVPGLEAPGAATTVLGIVVACVGLLCSASTLASSWRLRRWVRRETATTP